jgi:aryl-phospho-beta-D-glucosidase BglC (GH1 family)
MSDQQEKNGEKLNPDQQQQLLFVMLIQQHEQIAMMGMGKIQNPATGKSERDLKAAKYAIDTLVMLEKFTEGNLSKELASYIKQTLTNLRLNYADEKKKESSSGTSEKKDEKPGENE